MSASMRDWIGPLVESELNGALATFEGNYVPGQRVEVSHRSCGPEVVTVNVKKGREVQIIEVSSHDSYYDSTSSHSPVQWAKCTAVRGHHLRWDHTHSRNLRLRCDRFVHENEQPGLSGCFRGCHWSC
jgi:hypothetical protein